MVGYVAGQRVQPPVPRVAPHGRGGAARAELPHARQALQPRRAAHRLVVLPLWTPRGLRGKDRRRRATAATHGGEVQRHGVQREVRGEARAGARAQRLLRALPPHARARRRRPQHVAVRAAPRLAHAALQPPRYCHYTVGAHSPSCGALRYR